MQMRTRRFLVPILIFSWMLGACRSTENTSDEKIVGGMPSDNVPSIGMIMKTLGTSFEVCTGSFVGPNTMLTAAHCITDQADGSGSVKILVNNKEYRSTNVFHHGKIGSAANVYVNDDATRHLDFVVVVFSQSVVQKFLSVDLETARNIDHIYMTTDVKLSGYGMTDPRNPLSVGSKHFVTRKITRVAGNRIMTLEGEPIPASGDSGGPMFCNKGIIGILTSGRALANPPIAHYVNISHPDNVSLMRKAVAAGARISRL